MQPQKVLEVYSLYLKNKVDDAFALAAVKDALSKGDHVSAYHLSRMLYSRGSEPSKHELTALLLKMGREDLVPLNHKISLKSRAFE